MSMNNLANSYTALGRHAEALKLHRGDPGAAKRPSSGPTTPIRS